MKIQNKQTIFSVALILMLTLPIFAMETSLTHAAPLLQYFPTYGHISPVPNPVGVGQKLLVNFGLQPVPPNSAATINVANSIYNWNNMKVNVVKPDGTNDTLGPFNSDPTGNTFFEYTPTAPGNYTFQLVFPGQWMNYTSGSTNYTNYYYPSLTPAAMGQVTVQQNPVPSYPDSPFPTGYWTLPIYGEIKTAASHADNWLMNGYDYTSRSFTIASTFSPYTSAPNSPHIIWTTPVLFGGAMGGPYGSQQYYTGLAYEQYYSPLYILNGQIIYTDHGPTTSAASYGTRCLSLYTGEQLWYLANTTFAFAQVLEMDNPNEHGGIPYLWSTSGSGLNQTWTMWDAFSANTGEPPRPCLTVTNVTSGSASRRGTINFGPNGEILAYYLNSNAAGNWITMWNSTRAVQGTIGASTMSIWNPSYGSTINGARGIQWNVTLPNFGQTISFMEVNGGYILASNTSGISLSYGQTQMAFPALLPQNPDGTYPTTLNPLWVANRTVYMSSYKFSNVNNGAYAMFDEETSQLFCYNVATGAQIWAAPPLTTAWGIFSGYGLMIAYNNVYECGYDGHIRAYDVTTGKLNWDFYQGSAGYETPYGSWPDYWGMNIADGKVFLSNDEHSPNSDLWRGGRFIALNASTGNMIFNMSGQMHEGAISNGYYTASNNYDQQAYTFGKGPSSTTVSAPQVAVPRGTTVLFTGTVTDQSPGKPGTPAISDENMGAWMEYLYEQKPMPTNVKGVPVTLTAIDPNGNFQNIGTVTSDIGGTYGISWTPPVEGKYQITATFAGSNSYGNSYATTYLYVSPFTSPAPIATQTPTQTATPTSPPIQTASPSPSSAVAPTSGVPTTIYIAIAAAVIIVVVVAAALALRKRK
jgi:hypothetical protein